jgi:hypothetical protein
VRAQRRGGACTEVRARRCVRQNAEHRSEDSRERAPHPKSDMWGRQARPEGRKRERRRARPRVDKRTPRRGGRHRCEEEGGKRDEQKADGAEGATPPPHRRTQRASWGCRGDRVSVRGTNPGERAEHSRDHGATHRLLHGDGEELARRRWGKPQIEEGAVDAVLSDIMPPTGTRGRRDGGKRRQPSRAPEERKKRRAEARG